METIYHTDDSLIHTNNVFIWLANTSAHHFVTGTGVHYLNHSGTTPPTPGPNMTVFRGLRVSVKYSFYGSNPSAAGGNWANKHNDSRCPNRLSDLKLTGWELRLCRLLENSNGAALWEETSSCCRRPTDTTRWINQYSEYDAMLQLAMSRNSARVYWCFWHWQNR